MFFPIGDDQVQGGAKPLFSYTLILINVLVFGYEIMLTPDQSEMMVISSSELPTALVKSRFLKLNLSHIEYVMNSLQGNTTKVNNIKKYLLASLFNAPSTISGYYQAEVNHDMPQFARK